MSTPAMMALVKRALTVFAAGRDDLNAIGDAVLDVQVADFHTGNAAAVQAELERGPPCPPGIIAAAADEIAVPNDGPFR